MTIYLDNHATTPIDPAVLDAMLPYFSEHFGNAASINHRFGWKAADAVDESREQVAALIGTSARTVVFTSGATEANNLAIKGVMQAAGQQRHLIISNAEHRAVLDPAKRLQRAGFELTILECDQFGQVHEDQVREAIKENTALVSIMMANNEVGTINPIGEIAEVCQQAGVRLHCDAVQAAGKLSIDLKQLPVDLLSISAHKMYGPKGVGALIVRRDAGRIPIEPLIDGGGHENHLRSGTLPVPLIVGFGKAAELSAKHMDEEPQQIQQLRDSLWRNLSSRLSNIHRNGHATECLPGNLNVSFENIDGEALMNRVAGIAVSSGSACTTADPEPSHVLRAMGVSDSLSRASLRFGIGRFNTQADIVAAVDVVKDAVEELSA